MEIQRTQDAGIIQIPEGMSHDQIIAALKADKDLQTYGEQGVTVIETINRFPFDAAYALSKAAQELHRATIQHDKMLPDGSVIEAKLIGVPISPTENAQVPWGPFRLPDVEGELETVQAEIDGQLVLQITARIKRRYQDAIKRLAERTREIVEATSIYRGKAIKLSFRDEKGELDVKPPVFMDLSGGHQPIFSRAVQEEVDTNLLGPLRNWERVKSMGMKLKLGVLLSGTYGTGKTLTAHMVAREAIANGWTFGYLEHAAELPDALPFMRQFGRSVLFCEDVDRVTYGPRTASLDKLLNRADGIMTKDDELVLVMTTNGLERIHPAFRREKRVDIIIRIDDGDAECAERLLRHFGGQYVPADANLARLSNQMARHTPAAIQTIVERSLRELAVHNGKSHLDPKDLENAFHRHARERENLPELSEDDLHTLQEIESIMRQGGKVGMVPRSALRDLGM